MPVPKRSIVAGSGTGACEAGEYWKLSNQMASAPLIERIRGRYVASLIML